MAPGFSLASSSDLEQRCESQVADSECSKPRLWTTVHPVYYGSLCSVVVYAAAQYRADVPSASAVAAVTKNLTTNTEVLLMTQSNGAPIVMDVPNQLCAGNARCLRSIVFGALRLLMRVMYTKNCNNCILFHLDIHTHLGRLAQLVRAWC